MFTASRPRQAWKALCDRWSKRLFMFVSSLTPRYTGAKSLPSTPAMNLKPICGVVTSMAVHDGEAHATVFF
jgi:hypothetical protein